jgi:hypothetical protein
MTSSTGRRAELSGEGENEQFDHAVPLSREEASIAELLAAFPGSEVLDAEDLADVV